MKGRRRRLNDQSKMAINLEIYLFITFSVFCLHDLFNIDY